MKLKDNVYVAIKNDGRFMILSKILEKTGVGEAMAKEERAFTFFAPTDEAFSRLSGKALEILTSSEGSGVLAAVLGQHVIPQNYLYSGELRQKNFVTTLHGNRLKITEKANVLQIEEAHILMPAIAALNAVIFPIDKVLPASKRSVLKQSQ